MNSDEIKNIIEEKSNQFKQIILLKDQIIENLEFEVQKLFFFNCNKYF